MIAGAQRDVRAAPSADAAASVATVRATMRRCAADRSFARAGSVAGPLVVWLAVRPAAAAHGTAPAEPPTLAILLLGWTFEPLPTLAIGVVAGWWWWAVRRVDARPPGQSRAAPPVGRVPRLALLALAFALISGIERYDTTLFSVHMVQHILLMLVAAPLIALSARRSRCCCGSRHRPRRRRWILPVLHSRVMRVLASRSSPG